MKKAMRETYTLTVVAFLVVALIALVSACSGSSGGADDAQPSDDAQTSEEAGGHDEVAEHSEGGVVHSDGDEAVVAIRTEDVKFVPDTITVKVGQTVRLELDNHDPVIHDYTVDQPDFVVLEANGAEHTEHEAVKAHDESDSEVAAHDAGHEADGAAQVSLMPLHIAVDGDEHAELIFEATEPGEYVVYCSVTGHREAGMEGKIIVEE